MKRIRASSSLCLPETPRSYSGRLNFGVLPAFDPASRSVHSCRRGFNSLVSNNANQMQLPLWAGKRIRRETAVFVVGETAILPGICAKRSHGSHVTGEGFKWLEGIIRKIKGEKEEDDHDHNHEAGTKEMEKKFQDYKREATEAKSQAKNIKFVTYLGLALNIALGGGKYVVGMVC